MPFEWCALHGVWNALCACTRTDTSSYFARASLISQFLPPRCLPVSAVPTDRYEGEAHTKKSFAGCGCTPTCRCPAPVSFCQLLRCSEKIVFALVAMFMSSGPRVGMSAWNPRSVSLVSTSASILPLTPGIVMRVFISSCSGRDPGR